MRADLTMIRGTTKTFDLTLEDAEGNLPDLAGATTALTVQSRFRKTVTVDESSGEGTVTIDPADTDGYPRVRVTDDYTVQVTQDDGDVKVTQRGLFIVLPNVDSPTE